MTTREEIEERVMREMEIPPRPDWEVVSEPATVEWWHGVLFALEYAGEEYDGRIFESDLWNEMREAIGVA